MHKHTHTFTVHRYCLNYPGPMSGHLTSVTCGHTFEGYQYTPFVQANQDCSSKHPESNIKNHCHY